MPKSKKLQNLLILFNISGCREDILSSPVKLPGEAKKKEELQIKSK